MDKHDIKVNGYNSITMLWEIELNGKKETVNALMLERLIAGNIVTIIDKCLDGTSIYNQTSIDNILFMVKEKYKNKPYKTPLSSGTAERWVLCSDRLPKEYDTVLCATNAEEIFIANYLGKMNDGVDCFDDNNGMMWEGDVIAWQPLPQAYKGVEE